MRYTRDTARFEIGPSRNGVPVGAPLENLDPVCCDIVSDPEPDDFVVKKVADYFVPHFAIILAVSVLLVLVILFVMFYTLHRERRKRTMSCDDGASSPHDEVTEMAYYCVGDKPETAYL